MKLYLSSQRLGAAVQALRTMAGPSCKAAVIANAIDARPPRLRQEAVRQEMEALGAIGIEPSELDLRQHFRNPGSIAERLAAVDLIWVRGGNVFVLRRAMVHSGFDSAAVDLVKANKVVFGGYSAGAIVAAPDLAGSEIVDSINELPDGYPSMPAPNTALALLDYYLAPHWRSADPWASEVNNYVEYLQRLNRPVVPIRDGDVHIVVN